MILIIDLLLTFFDELFDLLWQTALEMLLELDFQLLAIQLLDLDVEHVLSSTTRLSKLELLLLPFFSNVALILSTSSNLSASSCTLTASLALEEPDDEDDELLLLWDELQDLLAEADLFLEGDLLLVDDLTEDLLLGGKLLAERDLLLNIDLLLVADLSLLDELEDCLLLDGETILLLFLGLGAGALPPRAGTSPSSPSSQT